MVLLETLKDFARTSSIHGVQFTVQSKLTLMTRLAWAIIVALFLVFASMQLRVAIICKHFYVYSCSFSLKMALRLTFGVLLQAKIPYEYSLIDDEKEDETSLSILFNLRFLSLFEIEIIEIG